MPYFLRAINDRTKWDRELFPTWVGRDDLPSCIVKDLKADDNALSLWEIPDDETNLPQVITAIVSNRYSWKDNFDFALLKTDYIDQINFTSISKEGTTAYSEINSFHRNLANLSMGKLLFFAHLLCNWGDFRRIGWKELRTLLLDARKNNKLDLDKVKSSLKKEIEKGNS